MKRPAEKNKNIRLFVVIMIVILVIGLAAGCFLVFFVPTSGSRQTAASKVKELGERYSTYGMENYDIGAVRTLIINSDGSVRAFYVSTENESFDAAEWPQSWYLSCAQGYLDEVMSGGEIVKTSLTKGEGTTIYAYTVSGAPLIESGVITGAVFMFKRDSTITTAILLFMVIFFIAWAGAFAYYLFKKQQDKRNNELQFVKERYVANVAHSLKTPITVIKGLSEALCDDIIDDPEKQKVYLRQIAQECTYQEKMVRNLLKLSELQSNGRDFSREEVLAEECFEDVLKRYDDLCSVKGLSLKVVDGFYNLPLLYTRAEYIEEVMEIILENALKFTESGSIFVRSFVHDGAAYICVKDNGPGISSGDMDYIFERFYKGKDIQNTKGSGLGLAIAREIMNGLKEKIWAESDGSGGAEFKFTVHLK